jgi:nucleotide-binding universal stress UspA family protein
MTTPIKTILLATNLQEYNKVAFDVASSLATLYEANLVLLHVLEKIPKSVEARLSWLFGEEERKKVLQEQAEKAQKTLTGKSITSAVIRSALKDYCQKFGIEGGAEWNPSRNIQVAEGDVVETILSNANEYNASMIVLGTHEGVFSKSAISRVVKNVLKNSKVPVLIVPNSFKNLS